MWEDRSNHWNRVYGENAENRLSWHQDDPKNSLELTKLAGVTKHSSVIDIGGGVSRYVECLIERGLDDVTVLDVSKVALATARKRIGQAGEEIKWLEADVTTWHPPRKYDLWHDRAVFHFLVDPEDRTAYIDRLSSGLRAGGHAVIATFAPDGPETCSGLPVARYDPEGLSRALGEQFSLVTHRFHVHQTPRGGQQSFQFSLFVKADRADAH